MSYILKPFNEFVKIDNLYTAWRQFVLGKRERIDVIAFERNLEAGLARLSDNLLNNNYSHSPYLNFFVRDPKFRAIHKAEVPDRVVHQALYNEFYPLFDGRFFFDSYSSRLGKGTQAAIARMWQYIGKESKNFNREVYIFHGDVDNFFASVNHQILLGLLLRKTKDKDYLKLCRIIIQSFDVGGDTGIPLGNLTSQVFANIYMHELDYFVKQTLGVPYYARYNDDFFIVSADKDFLKKTSTVIQEFLQSQLKLTVPDNKNVIKSLSSGMDILGAVAFPHGLVPRKRLRRAALVVANEITEKGYNTRRGIQLNSYIGSLGHTKSFLLRERLRLSLILNNQPV